MNHQSRNQKSSLIVGYHLYPEMRSLKSHIWYYHVYDIGEQIYCTYRTYQSILIAVDGHSSPMLETVQNSIMHSSKDTPFSDDIREEAATLKLFHHQCLSKNNAQATYFNHWLNQTSDRKADLTSDNDDRPITLTACQVNIHIDLSKIMEYLQ